MGGGDSFCKNVFKFSCKEFKNNGDIPLSISKSRKMIRNEKPKLWDHPFYWAPLFTLKELLINFFEENYPVILITL